MFTEQEFFIKSSVITQSPITQMHPSYGMDGWMCPRYRPASPRHAIAVSQLELCGFQEEISGGQSKGSIFSECMSSTGEFIWNTHSPPRSKSYQRNSGNQ